MHHVVRETEEGTIIIISYDMHNHVQCISGWPLRGGGGEKERGGEGERERKRGRGREVEGGIQSWRLHVY